MCVFIGTHKYIYVYRESEQALRAANHDIIGRSPFNATLWGLFCAELAIFTKL